MQSDLVDAPGKYFNANFYFDIHGHNKGTIPWLWKAASLFRMPKDRKLAALSKKGIGGVVCAVGDAASFKKGKVGNLEFTEMQIGRIKRSLEKTGLEIVSGFEDLKAAELRCAPAFVLGVEGGDFIGTNLKLLEHVYSEGVRLLGPMHHSVNDFGSVAMGWGGRVVPESEQTGLTDFGRAVIEEANRLGIILDLAHADDKTLNQAAVESSAPIICSHTGPQGLHDFARYISDESIRQIADSGGIIGLWPYYYKNKGMESSDAFKKAAQYLKNLVGTEAVAIGTDFNGVPGYMKGFADISESAKIVGYLDEVGFSGDEIQKITGRNFLRVFKDVEENSAL